MPAFTGAVFVLGFFVNFLLVMGSNQLFRSQPNMKKALFAAILGGLYSSVCLLPQLSFLGSFCCRILCLTTMSLIAFGFSADGVWKTLTFIVLSMAAGGITHSYDRVNPWSLLIASVIVLVLSVTGLPIPLGGQQLIRVELSYGEKNISLTALRDTGNTLRDPVTGRPVLVVGADAAQQLTGLSPQQLRQPIETIGVIPGLRLIPYKAIGGSGLLLALRVPNVKIGTWRGSGLVAFAPEVLNVNGTYQALTGGML